MKAPTALPDASRAVTIDDVARAASVHRGTVSRALRGTPGKVSAPKRAEIERIARELGYQPNAVAASLRTKQTHIAAIVVPDLGNPLFAPIVQALETELRKHHLMCLVVQTPSDPAERRETVVALANRQVSGLLILAAESDDPMLEVARQRRLPTVLVNRGSGVRQFSSVVNDDHESVRLALAHLVALGHRTIAHIAGPAASSTGRARRAAFEALLREQGLGEGTVVEAGAYTRAAGQAAADRLLAEAVRPSAIFAANDLIALGALDRLRAAGLRVPQDMSLVGHNDMPLVDLIDPPLTTLRVAVAQMGRQAASLFLDHLREPGQAPTMRVLMPELVVRASTGPPRG